MKICFYKCREFYVLYVDQPAKLTDKWQNRNHANSNLTLRKKLSALGCNDAEKRLKQDNTMINMVKIIIIRL